MKNPLMWSLASVVLLTRALHAEGADITKFADLEGGKKISEKATVNYLFAYFELGPKDASPQLRKAILSQHLAKLGSPPYDTDDVRKLYGKQTALETYDDRPGFEKIPVVTEPVFRIDENVTYPDGRTERQTVTSPVRNKLQVDEERTKNKAEADPNTRTSFSAGPVRLRRSTASIRDGFDSINTDGPDPKVGEAQGAKIGFSDNRLENGSGAWNSEGALYIPLLRADDTKTGGTRFGVLPAVSWNVQEAQKAGTKDTNELKFAAPLYFDHGGGGNGRYFNAILEPYYQTDTHFDGAFWGSTLAVTYIGDIPFLPDPFAPAPTEFGQEWSGSRPGLKLNRWSGIGKSSGYKVRLSGLLDYGEAHETSPYSPRKEDDDWFRIGLDSGLDIGLFRKEKDGTQFEKAPVVIGVSYKMMEALSGEGGYSDLFSARATWWMNDYAGLTLEYQQGESPVAAQLVDLLSLGLELRY